MQKNSIIAIGDVQGCLESLDILLEKLPSDAQLIFVGDLINRGPDSLGVLRRIQELGSRAQCLLGNHDLHLLAVAAGVRKAHPKDTIADILNAKDSQNLLDWIRHWPLMLDRPEAVYVHAALHYSWSLKQALEQAALIEQKLRSDNCQEELKHMYGNAQWSENLQEHERLQGILNVFTRIRYINPETGEYNYSLKDNPAKTEAPFIPWFEYEQRQKLDKPIVFGHWSTLGLVNQHDVIGLDTGCLWGGRLTAVRMPEREFISIDCPCWANPHGF